MQERFAELLRGYLAGTLTEDDRRELAMLLERDDAAEVLASAYPEGVELDGEWVQTEQRIVDGVLERIRPASGTERKLVRLGRPWRWLAAAVVLLFVAGIYILVRPGTVPKVAQVEQDAAPGKSRAVLILGDGRRVELDSSVTGLIARQGNAKIVRSMNGGVDYQREGDAVASGSALMNTLSTPRGGEYRLTLPDGTRVWLNAASAITYPTAFTGAERRVRVSGEAYFEISADPQKPFRVEVDGRALVEVLGTSFDVNGYAEEGPVKATLIEGRVRVAVDRPGNALLLKPGQQAQADGGSLKLVSQVDIDQVTAWKNGFFNFQDIRLAEVMRQLARWYDVDVVYEKGVPDIQFEGEISRNIKLSDLLKVLARADVKFRIEAGRRLVVLP
jgi:ferric-dicitrate binding protein FerR (iron transport regulator)